MTTLSIRLLFLVLAAAASVAQAQKKPYNPGDAGGKTDKSKRKKEITIPLDHFYVERQKRTFRSILSRFTLTVGSGAGVAFLRHQLNNTTLYQGPTGGPEIVPGEGGVRYSNWVNAARQSAGGSQANEFAVSSDTASLGFTGHALAIPIDVTLHYEIAERYRIGAGYAYEYSDIGMLTPISHGDRIHSFRPASPSGSISKYFAVLGVSFYRWNNLLLTADARIGGWSPEAGFSRNHITPGVYANAGLRAEYEFSEYLKVFLRPSFEFKSYTLNLPNQGGQITHDFKALYVGLGFSYRIPRLPRCFHPHCHAQIDHVHGNKEYRSRVHGLFEKQNPHYGENYHMPKESQEKYRQSAPRSKRKK